MINSLHLNGNLAKGVCNKTPPCFLSCVMVQFCSKTNEEKITLFVNSFLSTKILDPGKSGIKYVHLVDS